ncbi:MAG: GAF domain-containing protein [Anaerolineae bacterium]|nr:GAF domain-containing protein [Anaerolineae bacterium]
MPERDRIKTSPSDSRIDVVNFMMQQRTSFMRWMVWGSLLTNILTIGWSVLFYIQVQAWQVLVMSGFAMLAILCSIAVIRFLHQNKLVAGGYGVLAFILLPYLGGGILFHGTTGYVIVGAVLLGLVCGYMTLPGRWRVWGSFLVLFIVSMIVIERLNPVFRYTPLTRTFFMPALWLGGTIFVYISLIVWQIWLAFGIGTIRARLLMSYILLVLLPVIAVSATSIGLGWRSGQQQAFRRLDLEADLFEASLDMWVNELERGLNAAMVEGTAVDYADYILLRYMGLELEETSSLSTNALQELERYFERSIDDNRIFDDILLLNQSGKVIIAAHNDELRNQIYAETEFFQQGQKEFRVFFSSSEQVVIAVMPVFKLSDLETVEEMGERDDLTAIGVLVGRVSLDVLNEMIGDKTGLGNTGDIYLVGPDYVALTKMRFGEQGRAVYTLGTKRAVSDQESGSGLYVNDRGVTVVEVHRWLPRLRAALLVEQNRSEAFRSLYVTGAISGGIALLFVIAAVGVALFVTRSIVQPLSSLTETAALIAAGELDREAQVKREDEIGQLAQTFNTMTRQLRDVFGNLEQRVADRTRELSRQSSYLLASAQVGRAAASILDVEQLIYQVVELIRERFDLYYVGLFLVDKTDTWAILRAGTGAAGKAMLERGHHIKVGDGMIGWCIAYAQPRIASQAEADAVRLVNPELPDTRSEAALPLRSRGRVVGALSVQSTQVDAFDADTLNVLETMADQVGVAIDNARLFAEAQIALDAERRAYGQRTQEAWAELLRTHEDWGYRYEYTVNTPVVDGVAEGQVVPLHGEWSPVMQRARETGQQIQYMSEGQLSLALPVRVRGEIIGALNFDKGEMTGTNGSESVVQTWTAQEIALLETLTEQLGQTLERAQLYQETQQRAARERLAREITDKMRGTLNWDELMQVAIQEIGGVLNVSRAFVQWTPPETEQ